jgi:hypothetical protein
MALCRKVRVLSRPRPLTQVVGGLLGGVVLFVVGVCVVYRRKIAARARYEEALAYRPNSTARFVPYTPI